ncbi:hypothetical protein GCM10028794_00030 [Silanimonas algicola]
MKRQAIRKAAAEKAPERDGLYPVLRPRTRFSSGEVQKWLNDSNEQRVRQLSKSLADYLAVNLKASVERRSGLADYRTSPYVMLATASVMGLVDREKLARFLIDTKIYTGLETSFGKQVESQVVGLYPIGAADTQRWVDPPEKIAEASSLKSLTREKKAAARRTSVWREIDKSCVYGGRRYLVTIKSGPNCINDSQVDAMQAAIHSKYERWLSDTKKTYPDVDGVDIIIGLTYGTSATTNNKENQILVKLREAGFRELDRQASPGVLVSPCGLVRVYRAVGIDFWSVIGDPGAPQKARHVFLEVLMALALAMAEGPARRSTLDVVQKKVVELGKAITDIGLSFPRDLFPGWAQEMLNDAEVVWLQAAVSSFFDDGI